MKKLVAFCALALCLQVHADTRIFRDGDDSVQLHSSPCDRPDLLSRIPDNVRASAQAAEARVSGARYVACWIPWGANAYVFYEDGDTGVIPLAQTKIDIGRV